MARHFISVCIFCFICATHSPCASHAEVTIPNVHPHDLNDDPSKPLMIETINVVPREKLKPKYIKSEERQPSILRTKKPVRTLSKRSSDNMNKTVDLIDSNIINNKDNNNYISSDERKYLSKLFSMYGDGDTMAIEGFERLMNHLDISHGLVDRHESSNSDSNDAVEGPISNFTEAVAGESNHSCISRGEILSSVADFSSASMVNSLTKINNTAFQKACPALVYSMVVGSCLKKEYHLHVKEIIPEKNINLIWMCSLGAVLIISACGVLAVVIIPIMKKRYYKPLLQYLIAVAVGTLAGDAFLHLLPHAMTSGGHGHVPLGEHGLVSGGHAHESGEVDENTFKGFVAMLGLTFLFCMERFLSLTSRWKKRKHGNKDSSSIGSDTNKSSDLQCMDKYNPSPNCYKDIVNDPNTTYMEGDKTATTTLNDLGSNSDLNSFTKSQSNTSDKLESNHHMLDCPNDFNNLACTEMNKMLPDETRVAIREHESDHHGHSHKHGHAYTAPRNFSSVAWMVIMGDGLHNFTDGMAIGAAFAGSIKGGLSTAVAVFCHELPHELGDFAMLLKAGMTIKQALFYNLLSSVLCVLGNVLGVWLGNTESASSWVFALAAGMFIYIALVDMIPELSSAHKDEGDLTQFALHLSGLFTGIGIMALIALYEKDLKMIFNE